MMRSALLCILVAIIGSRTLADDGFRPTPIPLDDWSYDKREYRNLQESKTESRPVAVVPAHYWEDALRHSVYLTLVRDKIDKLIAKGDVVTKPSNIPKEIDVDDEDLWFKIKSAPFDRLEESENGSIGEVTTMAKGRLIEEKRGYRFSEDELSAERCDENCMRGVKAFWSVKRIRQRDDETGRYHYELTFSVVSEPPKKQKKPHETPIRSFTVKESTPETIVEKPKEHRTFEGPLPQVRPERAIWFHKNIVPTSIYQKGRQYQSGLDRIFSSLFSDDDIFSDPPPRYRRPYVPQMHPQYSAQKIGYVGSSSEVQQQKKLIPYPYKPHSYNKYSRPLPPPPHQYYLDMENIGVVNSPYAPQPNDHRQNFAPTIPTRPDQSPMSIDQPTPVQPPSNYTVEETNQAANITPAGESSSKLPEMITVYKSYNKQRPTPMKVSYFPDHVRPPVYNAPPGVFSSADKKPFKPMPPLKFVHTSRPHKHHRPIDFRPSPQVLDVQFSEPDPLTDSFRPILNSKYAEGNTTERIETSESDVIVTRKSNSTIKKPPKKHEYIKTQRLTTSAPEIITGHNEPEEDDETLEWANILGAFTKTTPMASQTEKAVPESTTPVTTSTTTTVATTTPKRRFTTTTEAVMERTSTTIKPKKRTRPPPKFNKPDKITKKHKRITTTSTTTTKSPERIHVRPLHDLIPQASSAATAPPKTQSEATNKTVLPLVLSTTATSTTITTKRPTTTTTTTTTTQATTTTEEIKEAFSTTQPKNKNRFRQSTLMQKGTSVNHDKWSAASLASGGSAEKNKTAGTASNFNGRRKGSNFQGYVSSTPKISDMKREEEGHAVSPYKSRFSSTTEAVVEQTQSPSQYDDTVDQYDSNSESPAYSQQDAEDAENDEQESRDHNEFIFQSEPSGINNDNEVNEPEEPSAEQLAVAALSAPKPKKCKKKKNVTTTEQAVYSEYYEPSTTSTTTVESSSTPDIFEELFGGFTFDDIVEKTKDSPSTPKAELVEEESENHERYVEVDDDFDDLIDALDQKEKHADDKEDAQYEEEDESETSIDEENSPFENEDIREFARHSSEDDTQYEEDYQERPYSFLELMAME